MADQIHINIGTPNGMDGEFVREAFDSTEKNFTELFSREWGGDDIDDSTTIYDGVKNENGLYTWIKYAPNATPTEDEMVDIATPATTYIGLGINKPTRVESLDYTDYEWREIDGDVALNFYYDENGELRYFWIKYAESLISPMGIVDTAIGMKYIGLGFDKLIPEPATVDYAEEWWFTNLEWHQVLIGNPIPGTNTYNWFAFATNASGTDISGFIDDKTYIGIAYEQDNPVSDINPALYTWSKFDAAHPEAEADGTPKSPLTYTHLKFTNTPDGALSDGPQGANYIGIRYGEALSTPESTVFDDYRWHELWYKGGGIAQPFSYTWLKYSAFEDGFNGDTPSMSDSFSGMSYIGIAINKLLPEDEDVNSDDPTFYEWWGIGEDLIYEGADGKTYYLWVKYATSGLDANCNVTGFTDDPNAGGITHIGISYAHTTPESTDPEALVACNYEWSLINSNIENHQWLYFWVKFSTSDVDETLCPLTTAVENFSDSALNATWMGIAYDKPTSFESFNPCDYVWNPLTGEQGYTGLDGRTYYTWVKFIASLEDGVPMFTTRRESSNWMGLSSGHLQKDSEDDSTLAPDPENGVEGGSENWRTYTWVSLDSEDGINGTNGTDGRNGIDGKGCCERQGLEEDCGCDIGQPGLKGDKGEPGDSIDQDNLVTVYTIPDGVTNRDELAAHLNAQDGLTKSQIENVVYAGEEDSIIECHDPALEIVNSIGTVTVNSIQVNWTDTDQATTGYRISWTKLDGSGYDFVELTDPTLRTYTITGLTTGGYIVQMVAHATAPCGDKSGKYILRPTVYETDKAYLHLTGTPVESITDTTVDLTWSVDSGFTADYYKIFDGGTGGTLIYETPHGTGELTKVITGLTPEQTYVLTAVAYTIADAPSVESDPLTITMAETVVTVLPPPVINIRSTFIYSVELGIVLSTDPATPSFTDFIVFYRELDITDTKPWLTTSFISTDFSPSIIGLSPDKVYEFKVQLYDSVSGLYSADSNIVNTRTNVPLRKADITFGKTTKLTPAKISAGWDGQLSVENGVPDTYVNLSFDVWASYYGNNITGTLEFENCVQVINSSCKTTFNNVPIGSFHTVILRVLLDEDGNWSEIFKVNAPFSVTVEFVVFAEITAAVEGTGIYKATRTYLQ